MDEARLGLRLWEPKGDETLRTRVQRALEARIIPFEGFSAEAVAPGTVTVPHRLRAEDGMLRRFAMSLLCPGFRLSASEVLAALEDPEALPGDVLRRFVNLQLTLVPSLMMGESRPDPAHPGQFALTQDLLCAPITNSEGVGEIDLPCDGWTDLYTGETHPAGLWRALHGPNTAPLLVRPGAVLPVGKCDRAVRYDYTDGVTLHWYQPEEGAEAVCLLPGGERFHLRLCSGQVSWETDSPKPWHLIFHRDGDEELLR